jgi:hypothetical protein
MYTIGISQDNKVWMGLEYQFESLDIAKLICTILMLQLDTCKWQYWRISDENGNIVG